MLKARQRYMIQIQASSNRNFHLFSFGCQMNVRDSAWLKTALERLGFQESPLELADVVLVNTCSVREKAEARVVGTIRRIRQASGAKIAILGCVAQQMGEALLASEPDVILVAGGDNLARVPEKLRDLLATNSRDCLLEIGASYPEKAAFEEPLKGGSAFVNIMQGCTNFCAYCIVPYTRGPEKFRKPEAIISESERWLEQGACELVMLGQNVNVWQGEWRGRHVDFAWLIRKLAGLDGVRRLRFLTSHPRDLSDSVIQAFGDLEQLCPSLHLPLQAGSDAVLARMRRGYSADQYLEKVNQLRAARPDIALATDIIVGFPGETEKDFKETLAMLEKCAFVSSYSFCYSDRPGTEAGKMPFKTSREESLARLARLQALQERLSDLWLRGRIGSRAELLIEARSSRGDTWQGRDPYNACVNIQLGGEEDFTGRLVSAVITEARRHSLLGREIGPMERPAGVCVGAAKPFTGFSDMRNITFGESHDGLLPLQGH